MQKFRQILWVAALGLTAHQTVSAQLIPQTGNSTAPSNWRITPGMQFNGVAALDASVLIEFRAASDGGSYACSGSLLAGGAYVLTAGHCGDDITSGTISFGYSNGTAAFTRSVTAADVTLHPQWQGFNTSGDAGSDLALYKLSTPVTTIAGYHISTTNDVGKSMLIAGYGTTQRATTNQATNWNDGNFGHYAFNTADVDSKTFNLTLNNYVADWGADASFYTGTTYMFDFDSGQASNNTLQRIADKTGNAWSSNLGVTGEGLIAGGDSGGGDYIWNGSEWLLSSVHSWGWQGNDSDSAGACDFFTGLTDCSTLKRNDASYGDLSGSTALYDQLTWIESVVGAQVVAVPEPAAAWLWLGGLALAVPRLRARRKA